MPFSRRRTVRRRRSRRPIRRSTRRSFGRFSRKARNYVRSQVVPRGFGGFPVETLTRLRYHSYDTLTPSAASVAVKWYRCNGPYDPDRTGGGGQPMGFDQWSTIYDYYTVLGAKITVKFWSNETTMLTSGILTDNDATLSAPGTISQLIESGRCVYKTALVSTTAGFGNMFTLSKKWSAKKWFALSNMRDCTDTFGSAVSTTPIREAFFGVFTGATDESADPGAIYADVLIEYIVRFSQLKDLARS